MKMKFFPSKAYFLYKIFGLFPKLSISPKIQSLVKQKEFQLTIRSKWWNGNRPRKVLHTLNRLTTQFTGNYLINAGGFNKNYMDALIPLRDIKTLDNGFGDGFLFFAQTPNDSSFRSSTTDQNRAEYFAQLSSKWWNTESRMSALHNLNILSMEFIQDCVNKNQAIENQDEHPVTAFQHLNVLDVGCGGGIMAEPLAKLGYNVTGIDVVSDLIEVAKEHARMDPSLKKLTYIAESIEEHALRNPEKYDILILTYVLHHVNDRKDFLNACMKCLKPGGSLFLSGTGKTTASWILGIILAERVFKIIYPGIHEWEKMVTIEEAKDLLEINNCKTKETRGLMYNVLNKKWFWIKNTSFYYILRGIKNY